LIFDVRNHGRSDSSVPVTILTFSEDIRNALDFLDVNNFKGPFILLGHSMGGASTLLTTAEDERVKGAISIASFADIEEILKRSILRKGLSKKLGSFIINAIERSLGREFQEISPYVSIKRIKVPLLLIHGTDDETVLIKDAYRLKKENPAAELFVVEGADHVTVLQDFRVHRKIREFLLRFS